MTQVIRNQARQVTLHRRWTVKVGILIYVLVLIGFGLTGCFIALSGVEAGITNIAFRALNLGLCLVIIISALANGAPGRIDSMLAAFFLLYLARLIYDWQYPGVTGAEVALQFFLVTVLAPSLAITLLGVDFTTDESLGKALLGAGVLFNILVLGMHATGYGYNPYESLRVESTRFMLESLNPITIGHAAGTSVIAGVYLLTSSHLSRFFRVVSIACVATGVWAMLISNSRGPLVAAIAALGFFFLTRLQKLVYVAPSVLLLPLLIRDSTIVENLLSRFASIEQGDKSAMDRLYVQEAAINAFWDSPLIGSFYTDPSTGVYPHNILIESAMALGLPGFLLLTTMLLRALWNAIALGLEKTHPLLVALFVDRFIGNLLSGSIFGADAFFMLLSPLLIGKARSREQ